MTDPIDTGRGGRRVGHSGKVAFAGRTPNMRPPLESCERRVHSLMKTFMYSLRPASINSINAMLRGTKNRARNERRFLVPTGSIR